MAVPARQNDFVAGNTILAAEVDEDFNDLFSWIATDAIHADGTNAFSVVPTGPSTDPSTDNHLARKAYVDKKAGGLVTKTSRTTNIAYAALASATWQNVASLDTTVAEVNGHTYSVEAYFPELYTNKNAILNSIATRIGARIARDGTTLQKGFVSHDIADYGESLVVRVTYTASATASKDWKVDVAHFYGEASTPATATLTGIGSATGPITLTVIDLGTGV